MTGNVFGPVAVHHLNDAHKPLSLQCAHGFAEPILSGPESEHTVGRTIQ